MGNSHCRELQDSQRFKLALTDGLMSITLVLFQKAMSRITFAAIALASTRFTLNQSQRRRMFYAVKVLARNMRANLTANTGIYWQAKT